MNRTRAAALAVAALALAGCGGASAAAGQSVNYRVCRHYETQRAWVKNLAEPTLADAVKFGIWVALDARQATPGTPLARDLAAMAAAQQAASTPAGALYDASGRVLNDCTALGVKFQP
jgi:hypothetical protein